MTRKYGHGIPPSTTQEEFNRNKGHLEVCRKMKADVIKGYPKCPNIVVSSVYDTKPVHYLSMVSYDLKWVIKEKYVFNVDTGITENLHFLHMNKIHNYKLSMGIVDVKY